MEKHWHILRCMPKIRIDGVSTDYDLHVLTMKAEVVPDYEFMCAAIDDAIHDRYLTAVLEDIRKIESGTNSEIEEETEGWIFWITPLGVRFEGKFDQGTGGQVTLAQFKLAVQTYVRFLQDPERKRVEVPFPEE
jgi:hypothetical protein